MKCVFCGAENEAGSKFCIKCEKELGTIPNEEDEHDKMIENFPADELKNKKSKKRLIISLVVIAILLFIGGTIGYLYFVKLSPKNVFKSYVNAVYNAYEKELSKNISSNYVEFEVSPKISDTNNKQFEDIINNLSIRIDGAIDYKNKEMVYNINSNYKGKKLINFEMQYDNNSLNILSNLLNNAIMTNVSKDEISKVFENKSNNDNIKVVVREFTKAFNDSLNNSYFESDKKNMDINGKKNVKTIVSILNLNSNNLSKITKDVKEKLAKNEEFIKSFAKLSEKEEKDIKEELNKNTENNTNLDDVKIILYTEMFSNKFLKMEITTGESKVEVSFKTSLNSYFISIKNKSYSVGFVLKYDVKENEKLNKTDVKDAISIGDVSSNITQEVLTNLKNQDGYKLLNKDIEQLTGNSIDTIIDSFSSLMLPSTQNNTIPQQNDIGEY